MATDTPHDGYRPAGPDEARAIPPHGPVSPEGDRIWPRPSPAARLAVYGGVALGAAGLTAAAILLGRRLAGSDAPAPARMAAMPEPPAPPPPRPRPHPRRNPALRLSDLTRTIRDTTAFLGMAAAGFRSVAGNADGLAAQLRALADAWREGSAKGAGAAGNRAGFRGDGDGDDERLHRL